MSLDLSPFLPESLFDIGDWRWAFLLKSGEPAWKSLGSALKEALDGWGEWRIYSRIPSGVSLLGPRVWIGKGVRIEPGATIVGPALIGDGAVIRTGAYVREYVVVGEGALVGAHTEVKGSILLPTAKAPHQAYVGDSILGRDVNLGAGTICSNLKNVGSEVVIRWSGESIHTGLRKLGALMGDGCKTGCNTVLNPGVVMGPRCVTYPNASVRSGYYAPGSVIKLRQNQAVSSVAIGTSLKR